jgi:hypothetical protein
MVLLVVVTSLMLGTGRFVQSVSNHVPAWVLYSTCIGLTTVGIAWSRSTHPWRRGIVYLCLVLGGIIFIGTYGYLLETPDGRSLP